MGAKKNRGSLVSNLEPRDILPREMKLEYKARLGGDSELFFFPSPLYKKNLREEEKKEKKKAVQGTCA